MTNVGSCAVGESSCGGLRLAAVGRVTAPAEGMGLPGRSFLWPAGVCIGWSQEGHGH